MGSLARDRVENIAATVRSSRDHAIRPKSFVDDVPPPPGSVIKTIGWSLKSCGNVWWIACFWRKLADNITTLIISFALEESCLKVYVVEIIQVVGGIGDGVL